MMLVHGGWSGVSDGQGVGWVILTGLEDTGRPVSGWNTGIVHASTRDSRSCAV